MKYKFIRKDEKECLDILDTVQHIFLGFGVTFDINEVRGKSRVAFVHYIRALISFYLRKRGFVLSDIGLILNRNHATVLNLLKYKTRKEGRVQRYDEIVMLMDFSETKDEIKNRIIWHQEQIILLHNKLKGVGAAPVDPTRERKTEKVKEFMANNTTAGR